MRRGTGSSGRDSLRVFVRRIQRTVGGSLLESEQQRTESSADFVS